MLIYSFIYLFSCLLIWFNLFYLFLSGETLFLKYDGENRRPRTAESYRSLATPRSVEEHSLYPYVCNPPLTPELREEVANTHGNLKDQNRYESGLRRKKKSIKIKEGNEIEEGEFYQ